MPEQYVHGYSPREAERLRDQAATVRELIHADIRFADGAQVLEPGCGVGAQTVALARNSPGAEIVSIELNPDSLRAACEAVASEGLRNVRLMRANLFHLPLPDERFDEVFVCYVLEHLLDPIGGLKAIQRTMKPGARITSVEGDHGSCYWHPETNASRAAWQCLIDVQAAMGGDSLIGRRLYPVLTEAGFTNVEVTPLMVYCDSGRPEWVDGFVRKTIIPMVEGVRDESIRTGRIDKATWDQGIRDLHAVADRSDGVFCYTFFKATAIRT